MDNKALITAAMHEIPEITGPIPVTEKSHPFCAMKYSRVPLDVEEYGYVEEEYFVSGRANVYDTDDKREVFIDGAPLTFKTRILVRKPKKASDFSGRIYFDIMNATQGYDIEDLWHRNYIWCMEHGHGYVGITSKPVNVQSLKNFDYERYCTLSFPGRETVAMPTISKSATLPGTEEGLSWDMLAQTATSIKLGKSKCFEGYEVKYLYLTGQSQSGAYLNTFASNFDEYVNDGDSNIIDGYLNIVGALVERSIRQENTIGPLRLFLRNMKPVKTPYICISSEADLYLFNYFLDGNLMNVKIPNSDSPEDKCRYYEIAGAPHTDIICPVLTATEEVEKTGAKMPNLDENLLTHINDFPTEYYICGLLEKLHIWATEGIAPPEVNTITREDRDLKRDEFGNALGGLRSPFLDVPIGKYIASNPEDPEGICGKLILFSKEEFLKQYKDKEDYLGKFNRVVDTQEKDGWISREDAEKMRLWAIKIVDKVI